MCRTTSQNYAKTVIRIAEKLDCIFPRRLREPLRKPSVSGVPWGYISAYLPDFLKFYTKHYILCFKTMVQIDIRHKVVQCLSKVQNIKYNSLINTVVYQQNSVVSFSPTISIHIVALTKPFKIQEILGTLGCPKSSYHEPCITLAKSNRFLVHLGAPN